MGQQLLDCHRLPGRGAIGDVRAESILYVYLTSLLQDHDCHRSELLSQRTNVKFGMWRVRHLVVPICHAIAIAKKDFAIACDQHRATELVGCGLSGKESVELSVER